MSLSKSLREDIPLINSLKEIQDRNMSAISKYLSVYCKVFQVNPGALKLAKFPKLRPRTEGINLTYHYFRKHIKHRII